jgi:hypothetical protein
MFVVDTNVLIYAADPDAELHRACRQRIEELRGQVSPWYVSWAICYEFLRICTHPRVFRKPWPAAAGWDFLDALLTERNAGILLPTERHLAVLREIIAEVPHLRGNIFHDAHTAALMKEHGIERIYTRDTDFYRFPFIKVIDPVA